MTIFQQSSKQVKNYKIRCGYNIPLKSVAIKRVSDAPAAAHLSVRPKEFHYVRPKLQVSEGDYVRIGSPLFFDKRHPQVLFASPAAGKVLAIQLGPRRVIERIVIENSSEDSEQWESFRPGEIGFAPREKLQALLLQAGMWPYIRQRPFDIIANPESKPVAIFVNCMDSAPLATDPSFALKERLTDFRAGLAALQVFCSRVNVIIDGVAEDSSSVFLTSAVEGLEYYSFSGPHPAGLVGTHIFHIAPLTAGKVVWYLNARDVVLIGSFFLTGRYPVERVVAIAGDGVRERHYMQTRQGIPARILLTHNMREGEQRIISGNLLTGLKIEEEDNIGFYDDLLTVIPEGRQRHFLGWLAPGLNKPTWSRAFLSALLPHHPLPINTNKNGELRALVKTGDYNKVMAMDILPDFLLKAILAEDIELMEQLGIYEIAPEDVALCSYLCPSKVEFTEIIRRGLDMMLEETS